ncbi:sporulation protein YtfJ [Halalkalibacillus sediminis]|uniref:Sporulation protein YtfJ n=1 Tax=Halalkalibacillus sediminis TaxID=2018042 RepID=A0A2I0QY96_9BACI|nr:GerW family sporulation protein [Halalkalibacillus sediminis]PKR79288.1 sporulation protein YtfJ [Halalkalibacillus sediminis]
MNEHPIQDMMATAMENLKDMIDVNTIIGDPIETPDKSTVILPVSRVGFGYAAGGSQFKGGSNDQNQQSDSSLPFGGGTGGGVSITPVAFLIVQAHDVKMVHLDENTHLVEKLIDLAPQAVEKIQHLMSQNNNRKKDMPNTPE